MTFLIQCKFFFFRLAPAVSRAQLFFSSLNFVCYYLNAFYSEVIIGYGIKDQIKDLLIFVLVCAIMLVLLMLVNNIIHNELVLLFLIPALGISAYIIISYFFKVEELFKMKEIFSGLIKKIKISGL